MIDRTSHLDAVTLYENDRSSLIRWFHEHGVPQVVQFDRRIIAPAV